MFPIPPESHKFSPIGREFSLGWQPLPFWEQRLVEFHKHAGKLDVVDIFISVCIPDGIIVNIIKAWSFAVFEPPASSTAIALSAVLVVVSIRSRERHPVANSGWMDGAGKCVAGVSAESRHAQTEIVGLRSHGKRRVFARVPQSGVSFDLKTHPARGACKDGSTGWTIAYYVKLYFMFFIHNTFLRFKGFLWSPYVIGLTIICSSCGFYLLSSIYLLFFVA